MIGQKHDLKKRFTVGRVPSYSGFFPPSVFSNIKEIFENAFYFDYMLSFVRPAEVKEMIQNMIFLQKDSNESNVRTLLPGPLSLL